MNRKNTHDFFTIKRLLWDHTPAPPREVYTDWASREPRTWFKREATHQVRLAWKLCILANQHGLRIRPRTTHDPGRILWEDRVQVVVRPHRECRVRPAEKPLLSASWDGDRATIRRRRVVAIEFEEPLDPSVWTTIAVDRERCKGWRNEVRGRQAGAATGG